MVNYADEIKRAVPAIELFEHYGFEINRAGFCRSPFAANDKTPSLKVYDGDRGWYDFSSGNGGDVIDFVREYFELSFADAQKKIDQDFRLGLGIGEPLTRDKQLEMERRAAERVRSRIEKDKTKRRVYDAYYDALDRWIYIDRLIRENEPKIPSEMPNQLYAYAINHIEDSIFNLDCAQVRLYNFEKTS